MKNEPCYDKEGNPIGWRSRSIAVVMFTFAKDIEGNLCILASQRGTGTPDPEFVGAWNCTCGYLDYNETTLEAAIRETWEETGVKVESKYVTDWMWNDEPEDDKRQNITHRFIAMLPRPTNCHPVSAKNSETNEVGDIKWIKIKDIFNYKWAFKHDRLILQALIWKLEKSYTIIQNSKKIK